MKNSEYWARRMRILQDALLNKNYEYVENLEKQYSLAISSIEKDISVWYQRLADNNEITLSEARKLLKADELQEFHWTVEEYIAKGEANALTGEWVKQLENASARVHISRLDALKLQLRQQAEELYGRQQKELATALGDVYSRGYFRTAFEVQKGVGVGWTLMGTASREIESVLSKPWTADGQTFSDRCWTNKQALVNSLNTKITQMVMRGEAPRKTIDALAKEFNVSKSKAGRLVMTESAAFANRAQEDCFKDLGVERYVIVGTLDGTTCELCGALDGKVYPMSERETGVTAPPFHPWCRCVTAPYYEDLEGIGDRFARDENGEEYSVPKDMSYEEWKKKYIEKPAESDILSTAEEAAVKRYMSAYSYGVNDALRNGETLTDEQAAFVRDLDSALNKLPNYKGTVYRSVSSEGIPDISAFIAQYQVNSTPIFLAYTSTSADMIYDDTMPLQYVITSKTGVDIRAYNAAEGEVIFQRKTMFKVIRVDGNTIYMEEV